MNRELKTLLRVTRSLPPVPGAGWLANKIKAIYNRKRRSSVIVEVLGFEMELEPQECVDGELLFYPQLYDRRELAFLKGRLTAGDVFVDAGANVGIYSLVASKLVGARGRVISIEADPYSAKKLRKNVQRNKLKNITIEQVGLSDKKHTLTLHQQKTGNRGGSTFVGSGEGVLVDCLPLQTLLEASNVTRVGALKIDIEGFEHKVLRAFFSYADYALFPQAIILESNPMYDASGQLSKVLFDNGYSLAQKIGLNHIWLLK